jgi:glycosyltransferase involved in cell wall biosynthesis
LEKKKILIEASKLSGDSNDGCKRYVIELLKGLKKLEPQWRDRWEIDIYFDGKTHALIDTPIDFSTPEDTNSNLSNSANTTSVKSLKEVIDSFLQRKLSVSTYNRLIDLKLHQYAIRKQIENYIKVVLKIFYFEVKGLFANKYSYDLIHLPLPVHFVYPYSKDTRFVTTIHDFTHRIFPEFHVPSNIHNTEKGIRYSLKRNSSWIAISESTKADLIRFSNVSEDKIFTILEAADKNQFKPTTNETELAEVLNKYKIPNKPYLLSLSTLEPRKNITNVIKAFNLLLEENPSLDINMVVSGKIGWRMNLLLDGLLDKNGERIIFTGFVDDSDLPKLYSKARALTYVSYYEGFGLPPLEAMSCGTPVIFGNNSSQVEIVGDSGLAADPKSVVEIKDQMYKLCSDEKLAEELRVRALDRAAMFSWDRCVDETIDCYNTLLST